MALMKKQIFHTNRRQAALLSNILMSVLRFIRRYQASLEACSEIFRLSNKGVQSGLGLWSFRQLFNLDISLSRVYGAFEILASFRQFKLGCPAGFEKRKRKACITRALQSMMDGPWKKIKYTDASIRRDCNVCMVMETIPNCSPTSTATWLFSLTRGFCI